MIGEWHNRPDRSADRAPGLTSHLTLQQLAYVREVGRSETVTAAAGRLAVSQPALSQALAELERRLEVSLFDRSGRRLRLTEAGERVVRLADEVLGHAEAFERWLEGYRLGRSGTLSEWG